MTSKYVKEVDDALANAGDTFCSWICEPLMAVGGYLPLPQGYLQEVYHKVHSAGGLCIADESQVGFGRVGTHWWSHQLYGPEV